MNVTVDSQQKLYVCAYIRTFIVAPFDPNVHIYLISNPLVCWLAVSESPAISWPGFAGSYRGRHKRWVPVRGEYQLTVG